MTPSRISKKKKECMDRWIFFDEWHQVIFWSPRRSTYLLLLSVMLRPLRGNWKCVMSTDSCHMSDNVRCFHLPISCLKTGRWKPSRRCYGCDWPVQLFGHAITPPQHQLTLGSRATAPSSRGQLFTHQLKTTSPWHAFIKRSRSVKDRGIIMADTNSCLGLARVLRHRWAQMITAASGLPGRDVRAGEACLATGHDWTVVWLMLLRSKWSSCLTLAQGEGNKKGREGKEAAIGTRVGGGGKEQRVISC